MRYSYRGTAGQSKALDFPGVVFDLNGCPRKTGWRGLVSPGGTESRQEL